MKKRGLAQHLENQDTRTKKELTPTVVNAVRKKLLEELHISYKKKSNDGIIIKIEQRDKATVQYGGQKIGASPKKRLGRFTFSQAKIFQEKAADDCSPSKLKRLTVSKRKLGKSCCETNEEERKDVNTKSKPEKDKQVIREAIKKMQTFALRLKELRDDTESQHEPIPNKPANKEDTKEPADFYPMIREESIQKAFSNITNFTDTLLSASLFTTPGNSFL